MPWPLIELSESDEEEVYLGTSDGKPKVMFAVKTLLSGERVYRVLPLEVPETYYCTKCNYRHFGCYVSKKYAEHKRYKLEVCPKDQ